MATSEILELVEEDDCPSCGLDWSSTVPAESFSGFAEYDVRACLHEGRVYIHSDGDVNGYD